MNRKQRRQLSRDKQSGARSNSGRIGVGDSSATAAALLTEARQQLHLGRLRDAEIACRRVLAANPEHGHALHLLGVVAGRAGDLKSAYALLKRSAAALPNEPAAHLDLGTALLSLGQDDEALASYSRALVLNPDLLPARIGKGNALKSLGRLDEAEQSFRQIVALSPSSADAHASLGDVLKELERDDEAIAAFETAVSLNPRLAEAHGALGILLWRQRRFEEAFSSFRTALAVKPDYRDIHTILGRLLLEQERGIEAEEPFRKLLSLAPDDPRAQEGLGMALDYQGRHAEAEIHLRRAVEGDPTRFSAHRALINNFALQGRMEDAHAACRSALEHNDDPAQLNVLRADLFMQQGRREEAVKAAREAQANDPARRAGLWHLSRIGKLSREDDVFKQLEALSRDLGDLAGNDAAQLEFAISKAYQDVGEDDLAFQYLAAGNLRKREGLYFNIESTERSFDEIATNYDRDLLDRLGGSGVASDLPTLIVGMPRSGTTLTEQIIASHPDAFGAGELRDLGIAVSVLNRQDRPPYSGAELASILTPDSIGEIGRRYVDQLHERDSDALRITDKMPLNFLRLGLIHLALPNARIIHCVRNPVDTCLSCFQQLFASGNQFAYDLSELGRYYRAYRKLMDHWRNVLPPGRILDVRYEDTVAEFEAQARRVVGHCGLPWDEACLSFHETKRQVRTASVTQVRQPIYRSSVAKWRRYEKHLGPLLDALGDAAEDPVELA